MNQLRVSKSSSVHDAVGYILHCEGATQNAYELVYRMDGHDDVLDHVLAPFRRDDWAMTDKMLRDPFNIRAGVYELRTTRDGLTYVAGYVAVRSCEQNEKIEAAYALSWVR